MNGLVYDSHSDSFIKQEVLLENGLIKQIGPSVKAAECTLDAAGQYVLPGLVDMHVHVFSERTQLGVDPDTLGIEKGVTTIVDAGSSGSLDFVQYQLQLKKAKTCVYSFINYSKIGLTQNGKELSSLGYFDEEQLLEVIGQYSKQIAGIKLRVSSSVVGSLGFEPIVRGVAFARRAGLPVMVHVGNMPPKLESVLEVLQAKDIVTHCFHGKPGGMLEENGKVKDIVFEKYRDGVLFDIGNGSASFNFEVAEKAIAQGLIPYTISTDFHKRNYTTSISSLCEIMSKCLQAGMDIPSILKAVSIHPRRYLQLPDSLAAGEKADICILKLADKPATLKDAEGNVREVKQIFQISNVILGEEEYRYGE